MIFSIFITSYRSWILGSRPSVWMQLYLMMNKVRTMTFPILNLEIPFYMIAALIFYFAMGIVARVSATGLAASWSALSHDSSTSSY